MPKIKSAEKIPERVQPKPTDDLEKIIEIDPEEKLLEEELVPGELEEDESDDDDATLDEEEVDPFKDKWEE